MIVCSKNWNLIFGFYYFPVKLKLIHMFKFAKVCNNLLTLKSSTEKDRMLCFGSCFGKIQEVCEYKKKRLSWILVRAKQHSESEDEDPYYLSLPGRENMASVIYVRVCLWERTGVGFSAY